MKRDRSNSKADKFPKAMETQHGGADSAASTPKAHGYSQQSSQSKHRGKKEEREGNESRGAQFKMFVLTTNGQ